MSMFGIISEERLHDFLVEMGYKELRNVEGVGWCGVHSMAFTVGVHLALDGAGPSQGRYCFNEWAEASHFLKHWDGKTEPVAGKEGCTANKRVIYTSVA